ncbi:hypothetical protein [Roseibium aestuarii]|uniref:Glycosyltransferase RgtA/B/C/D-like domain-containing protein n=1 Tax=Roseibium aestuarii TaxID=2600299 RepID=A0ABW4JZL8_9HYPH|nr:hypothetical protein [Roseibium aestuarii]
MNPLATFVEDTFRAIWSRAVRLYYPQRHLIGGFILLLFTVMTVAVVKVYPLSNWDMFAYTAAILEDEIDDSVALHDKAYALMKADLSEGEYLTLTQDREYRIRQAEDPRAFATMMGFYDLKLGYVETARLLAKMTDPVSALRWISILSAAATGVLLMRWLARYKLMGAGPIVVSMLLVCGFGPIAALVTPDLYASFFLLLAFYLYCEKHDIPAALCLLAALFIRPDHLAFIGVFFVFALVYGPRRLVMTACFAAACAAYMFILKDEGHPGWWVHMWFTHVEYVPTLEGFNPPFSPLIYVQMLVRSTVRSLTNQTWVAVLFALAIFHARCINKPAMPERPKVLLYAIFTSIIAKYFVFPHYETRFYFPYLMGMGMILLVARMRQDRGLMS